MGTSRLAGRVPQDQFAEFTAEVEARRERLVAAEAEAGVRLNALETTFSGLEATASGLQASFDDFAVQQVASRVALTRLLEKLAL